MPATFYCCPDIAEAAEFRRSIAAAPHPLAVLLLAAVVRLVVVVLLPAVVVAGRLVVAELAAADACY